MTGKEKTAQFIPMTRTQAAIGGSILISFFVVWFLWAAVGEAVMCWIEAHPGMASWVQAIGSIAAIVATALGTRWQILKSKYIQEQNEKKNNIHMSETCLEMCNAIFSIIESKERKINSYIKFKYIYNLDHELNLNKSSVISTERLSDLQKTIRLIIMKNLPVDLLKSLFQLQKIVAKYKETICCDLILEDMMDKKNFNTLKIEHRKIRDDVNGEIRKILNYKNSLKFTEKWFLWIWLY